MRSSEGYFTQDGRPTRVGEAYFADLERQIAALQAKLAAVAAVAGATGGATVDTQARAELVAIKGALA